MDLITLSTVLTIITASGDTLDKGYEEFTQGQLTCAAHIDMMLTLASLDNAEADAYCLHRATSMRPRARPEGLGQ